MSEISSLTLESAPTRIDKISCTTLDNIPSHIDRIIERFERLLLVRSALGYQKSCLDELSARALQSNIQSLVATEKSRSGPFRHCAGFFMKTEFDEYDGPILRFIFFYDGSRVDSSSRTAQQVECYWINHITNGAGKAFEWDPGNQELTKLEDKAIDRSEKEKRRALLDYAAAYLSTRCGATSYLED